VSRGIAYLVGAGPGDPGLLTIRGQQCIAEADVVIFDRLVNLRLLSHTGPNTELIYAGKSPDGHTLTQDQINEVLVARVREGKTVARVKGGDPFIFGRGGEEAEALAENDLDFEIVPGVTSAIAAPAYAGIPLTHRDFTTSVAIITGNEDPTKDESTIAWDKLSTGAGTLVFLMGMANLPKIVERLKRHGRPGDTPSSVIRWGTWPEQVTVVGMLDDIVEKVQAAGLKNPAVIVVGEVCKLRDRLKWIERRPLFGRRILVTRSREQASVLSNTIARLGGEALEFPTIAIEEPLDWTPLDRAIQEIGAYNWVVFTSVNGVRYFFARLRALGRDVRGLAGVRICAIGPVTKAALEERGLLVEYVPVEFQAAEIARGMQAIIEPGDRILLPRADIAPKMLAEALERMGARVDDVTTYRTVPGTGDVEAVREMFETGRMDMVTFTSSSTVRNFVSTLGADRIDGLLKGVAVACIGPVTADTAVEYGLKVDAVADEHTIDGLVAAIRGYFGGSGS
jgi:uroporphyrinogen III methyltransferase/synthase